MICFTWSLNAAELG